MDKTYFVVYNYVDEVGGIGTGNAFATTNSEEGKSPDQSCIRNWEKLLLDTNKGYQKIILTNYIIVK